MRDLISNYVEELTWEQAEDFLSELIRRMGYKIILQTTRTKDHGADLIAEKDGITTIFEYKKWKNNIGSSEVAALIGSMNYWNAKQAIFITSSYYTDPAKEHTKGSSIELWDRDRLFLEIENHFTAYQLKQPEQIFEKTQKIPITTTQPWMADPNHAKASLIRNTLYLQDYKGSVWKADNYPPWLLHIDTDDYKIQQEFADSFTVFCDDITAYIWREKDNVWKCSYCEICDCKHIEFVKRHTR